MVRPSRSKSRPFPAYPDSPPPPRREGMLLGRPTARVALRRSPFNDLKMINSHGVNSTLCPQTGQANPLATQVLPSSTSARQSRLFRPSTQGERGGGSVCQVGAGRVSHFIGKEFHLQFFASFFRNRTCIRRFVEFKVRPLCPCQTVTSMQPEPITKRFWIFCSSTASATFMSWDHASSSLSDSFAISASLRSTSRLQIGGSVARLRYCCSFTLTEQGADSLPVALRSVRSLATVPRSVTPRRDGGSFSFTLSRHARAIYTTRIQTIILQRGPLLGPTLSIIWVALQTGIGLACHRSPVDLNRFIRSLAVAKQRALSILPHAAALRSEGVVFR